MSDRPCNECVWKRNDTCTKWGCEPMTYQELGKLLSIVKCGNCANWQTGIAYSAVGKCKLHDRICNRNYYCADGREKE